METRVPLKVMANSGTLWGLDKGGALGLAPRRRLKDEG